MPESSVVMDLITWWVTFCLPALATTVVLSRGCHRQTQGCVESIVGSRQNVVEGGTDGRREEREEGGREERMDR